MRCRCYQDDEGMRMLGKALVYAMTEFYAVFHKPRKIKFLFFEFDHDDTMDVRVPKHHESDYDTKLMEFKKECIALIDAGYTNGDITDELADKWRIQISEYHKDNGVVWE